MCRCSTIELLIAFNVCFVKIGAVSHAVKFPSPVYVRLGDQRLLYLVRAVYQEWWVHRESNPDYEIKSLAAYH